MSNGDVIREWNQDKKLVANKLNISKPFDYSWKGWESFPDIQDQIFDGVLYNNVGVNLQRIDFEVYHQNAKFN